MIVEIRYYKLHIGKLHEYVSLYKGKGFDIQSRHLGQPIGWYTPISDNQNAITHIWQYQDFDDRDLRRKALFEDPEWLQFITKTGPLIKEMTNRFVSPISFETSS